MREWLGGRDELEVLAIDVDDSRVVVDVAGPVPPPPPTGLADLAVERLGTSAEVTVRWTERHTYPALPEQVGSARQQLGRARAAAELWVSSRTGLDVVDAKVDGGAVTIDLAGEQPPEKVRDLVEAVRRELDPEIEVVVRFSERRRLLIPEAPERPPEPAGPAPSPAEGQAP